MTFILCVNELFDKHGNYYNFVDSSSLTELDKPCNIVRAIFTIEGISYSIMYYWNYHTK